MTCREKLAIEHPESIGYYTGFRTDKSVLSANDYQKLALKFEQGMSQDYPRIVMGLMGLNGEAGEAIDILKKHLFHFHELDKYHLARELGDVAWYLAMSADAIGYSLEEIFEMNLDKLSKRYPEGHFDPEHSKHRKEGDI